MMSKGKSVLIYLLLVGGPFLGVIGVLRLGDSLQAPPSIAGDWELDARLDANANTPCSASLGGFQRNFFTISQSGKFVEVQLPNSGRDLLRGALADDEIRVEAAPALFGDDVFQLLRISGRISQDNGVLTMHGVLSMPRRIDCVPIPFLARRVHAPVSRKAAH